MTTAQEPAGTGPRAALSVRSYRWWFGGQVLSASGTMTQLVAVASLVLRWHGDGFRLGLLSTAGLGPVLLLGLWAGSLIDHYDRRRLLIATQTLFFSLSMLLFALIVSHTASYWPLIAITAANGVVNAVDSPARQIYVLDLVGDERVAGAVSLYEVILNLSRVLGPAVGGALLVTAGAAACVLANALSYLAPLIVLLCFRPAAATRPGGEDVEGAGRPSAWEGVRYAWSQPLLRACVLLAAASGVLFASTSTLPLLATRVFHLGDSGYGLLLALFGAGALPGALLASRSTPTGARVRLLAVLTGIAMALAACAPDRPVLFAGMVATGCSSIAMIAAANTLVQLRTAPELRGRVMGAWTVALPGTVPFTALAAGLLTDACGARVAFSAAGALIGGTAVACWRAYADG